MGTRSLLTLALLTASTQVAADIASVEIKNLTHGSYFTPLIITQHSNDLDYFSTGSTASSELQAMAEGGDISGLASLAAAVGADSVENPAEGLLAPGASVMTSDLTDAMGEYLSITAMILPSNDGFVGLDSWPIPGEPGTYTIYLNAYDAGTEANDELVNGAGAPGELGIPANPGGDGGSNGTGVTTEETNQMVHIHRGVLGDTITDGGISDLDSRIHRWLNPVASVTVVVE